MVQDENGVASGFIVETEAYTGPEDPAAHGFGNRKSRRNASMFEGGGVAYVYFIYGIHWCFNAVTGEPGHPAAVLVRALEPRDGIDLMRRRRGRSDPKSLCSGPAKLCEALGIDGGLDGATLQGPRVWLEPGRDVAASEIKAGPRVGISKAIADPLRFWIADNCFVSR